MSEETDHERDLDTLRAELALADGADDIAVIFAELVERVGTDAASRLWWAVFGELDAPRTG